MSDEAKIAYLKDKIKEAKRSERRGAVISVSGLMLIIFTFIGAVIRVLPAVGALLVFGIIAGVLVIMSGMAISINYAIQGGVLTEQLRRMAENGLAKCVNTLAL